MGKFVVYITVVLLSSQQTAVAGEYIIDKEGDGGWETYMKVDPRVDFVVAGCQVRGEKYGFTFALEIDTSGPDNTDSMLNVLATDAESAVNGEVCVGDFCRKITFDPPAYFSGPSAFIEFFRRQVSAANAFSVRFPGGVYLEWEGELDNVFRKSCQ